MAGLALAGVLALEPALAAQSAQLRQTEEGDHVIVDAGAPTPQSAILRSRPVPVSSAVTNHGGTLGNIRVELPVHAGCGYSDAQHLVVCLDVAFGMSETQQLQVLAFTSDPYRLTAGSPQALATVRALLLARPRISENAQEAFGAMPSCTGACERRVGLEAL